MDGVEQSGIIDGAAVRALASQVKLQFTVPAVATGVFGALLAPAIDPVACTAHIASVALALYVAHLRDERADAHIRGEEAPSVPRPLLRWATLAASVAFLLTWAAVWLFAGLAAAVLAFVPWLLGFCHAPYLDTNPITVSLDYPVAVAFVVVGGYVTQTGRVPGWLLWIAGTFLLVLAGATISLDRLDRTFDRQIGKQTVPVIVGDDRAAGVAAVLEAAGGMFLIVGALAGPLPRVVIPAAVFPLLAAVASHRSSPARAVWIQMVAAYPFGGVLFAGLCLGVGCALTWAAGI